jgi:hypothetical protein
MRLFISLCLVWSVVEGAIIPDTLTSTFEFHQCLVEYLASHNITSDLKSTRDRSDIRGCEEQQIGIESMIEEVYVDVSRNLETMLPNSTEAECLSETFRAEKFFEISIVLSAATLTDIDKGPELQGVYNRCKNIFLFAFMKCLMTEEIFVEIFNDFSVKMNVTDEEFKCIQRDLQLLEGIVEGEEVTGNEIKKASAVDNSVEVEAENQNCSKSLEKVGERIKAFEFPSLNLDQNKCMAEKTTADDVKSVFEFIVMKRASKTSGEVKARNEKLKGLVVGFVWNIIECTDIFGFYEIIENLLPTSSSK